MSNSSDFSDDLYYVIKNNPGIHFRAIMQKVDRQTGVVDYHLKKLVKQKYLITVKHRGHKLYFDFTWEDKVDRHKKLIDNLRKTMPRSTLLFLANSSENQELPLNQIARSLQLSPSNLQWHIKRLIEDDLLVAVRKGRLVSLKLNMDIERLKELGNDIYPNRWDRFLDDIEQRYSR